MFVSSEVKIVRCSDVVPYLFCISSTYLQTLSVHPTFRLWCRCDVFHRVAWRFLLWRDGSQFGNIWSRLIYPSNVVFHLALTSACDVKLHDVTQLACVNLLAAGRLLKSVAPAMERCILTIFMDSGLGWDKPKTVNWQWYRFSNMAQSGRSWRMGRRTNHCRLHRSVLLHIWCKV